MCCNFRCHRGDGAFRKQRVRCLATRHATKNTSDMYCGTRHRSRSGLFSDWYRCSNLKRDVARVLRHGARRQKTESETSGKRRWGNDRTGQQQVPYPGPTNFSVFCRSFRTRAEALRPNELDLQQLRDPQNKDRLTTWKHRILASNSFLPPFKKCPLSKVSNWSYLGFSPGRGHQSADAGEDKIRTLRLEDILVVFHVSSLDIFLLDLSL